MESNGRRITAYTLWVIYCTVCTTYALTVNAFSPETSVPWFPAVVLAIGIVAAGLSFLGVMIVFGMWFFSNWD